MSALDFMHGSSFANALNSVVNNHREELDFEYRKKAFEIIDALKQGIVDRNATIEEQNEFAWKLARELDAGLGFIRLLEEENLRLQQGVLTGNRLSGNDQLRKNIRKELEKLSKIDRDLACAGGRFSGRRIDNLREVLHMRIEEFFAYAEAQNLIFSETRQPYNQDLLKAVYDDIERRAKPTPEKIITEVILLQRVMNKNYDLAVDITGGKPEGYPYKPVNLIAAVGYTVEQLCKRGSIDPSNFKGHKWADPPLPEEIFDPQNDGAVALLNYEYATLDGEIDEKIKRAKLLDDPEDMIRRINETIPDFKARVAAKISVVKYAELAEQLGLGPKSPMSGG